MEAHVFSAAMSQSLTILPESKTNEKLHLSKLDFYNTQPVCLSKMQAGSLVMFINEKVEVILNGILT